MFLACTFLWTVYSLLAMDVLCFRCIVYAFGLVLYMHLGLYCMCIWACIVYAFGLVYAFGSICIWACVVYASGLVFYMHLGLCLTFTHSHVPWAHVGFLADDMTLQIMV